MPKYRKKPVVVEASQWFPNIALDGVLIYDRFPACDKATQGCPCNRCVLASSERLHKDTLHGWVQTLEGWHIISPGDYLITGVKGEKYPCKPDIFEMTYELA